MMKTNGYSWTVLLRRINGLTNFYRNWKQYKKGFGSVFGEYWIGNENLYLLTKQKNYQLLIEKEDFSGNKPYAFYNTFSVGSENEKYKLSIGGYYGIAGNSMINHNGMNFATFDNDTYLGPMCGGCPVGFSGGYWYNCCYQNHLTGPIVEGGGGMAWLTWTGYKSLKPARMMIRPRN
ncbi:angiopoietin-related protein 1-like [Mytilus edulis]|uniref:angiopoietin-related protein 1-like n=1 Tax=Mytilus edulis TaxID=6550 RepID=UPI0039EFBEE8